LQPLQGLPSGKPALKQREQCNDRVSFQTTRRYGPFPNGISAVETRTTLW